MTAELPPAVTAVRLAALGVGSVLAPTAVNVAAEAIVSAVGSVLVPPTSEVLAVKGV
jgi:hypothetical protein